MAHAALRASAALLVNAKAARFLLFHPDAANDVAPGGYNAREPQTGLPTSPLEPQIAATGFRWG